jgi:hypothetical protein
MDRRPVGVAAHNDNLVVVCDDGTVWEYVNHSDPRKAWKDREPIPGTIADTGR